jgi:hypothetical protein
LIAIALEDVGPAYINRVIETVAAAVSPDWLQRHDEARVIASITFRLAHRSRSAQWSPGSVLGLRYFEEMLSGRSTRFQPEPLEALAKGEQPRF